MTSNSKLILPLAAVILFMVAGVCSYVFYWQEGEGQEAAAQKVVSAYSHLNSDFARILIANRDFANRLAHDQSLADTFTKQDRAKLADLLKNAIEGRGFSGFVTIFDDYGKVVYSSDTPNKFGYSLRGKNPGVDYVLSARDAFSGTTSGLSLAPSVTLTSMVPLIIDGSGAGIVAVSEPIDEEFLTGESTKLALLNEPLTDIDFVLLNLKDNHLSLTPGLLKDKPSFIRQLNEQGAKAIPNWQGGWQISNMFNWLRNLFHKSNTANNGFAKDGRYWQQLNLNNVAVLLAATPIESQGIKPGFIIIACCIMGLAALLFSAVLSVKLSSQPDNSAQLLLDRLKIWRKEKRMPPAVKLSGNWQDLNNTIDEVLQEDQNALQTLKIQLNKLAEQNKEKLEQAQVNDEQFASVNRQVANQNRQISEFSRQLNYANQQAVFLQNELQAILQSSSEGYLILDQYGNVINANNVFLGWLGMTEAEAAGRFCFDLVRNPHEHNGNGSAPGSSDSGRAFVKHESDPSALINQFFPEGIIKHAQTGQTIDVLLHLQPVAGHGSNIQGYILVARDKSLRSEVAGLKEEIVNILARAVRGPLLNAEKEWQNIVEAQKQIDAQKALGTAAHLSPELVQEGDAHPELHVQLNRELNRELKQVVDPGQRLANLRARYHNLLKSVENLLATHGQSIGALISSAQQEGSLANVDVESMLYTNEPAKEIFPISRLIGDCLSEVSNLARERQLLLDHKTSTALPSITGDRSLMKSIITPIVEKIISITAPGGRVRVESSARTGVKGKTIHLSIASSGPALPEEEIADMFAGFIPEKHSEDTYGARLALYLARNNAERVGANIWAQSEAGRGTTVYITLPIEAQKQVPAKQI